MNFEPIDILTEDEINELYDDEVEKVSVMLRSSKCNNGYYGYAWDNYDAPAGNCFYTAGYTIEEGCSAPDNNYQAQCRICGVGVGGYICYISRR